MSGYKVGTRVMNMLPFRADSSIIYRPFSSTVDSSEQREQFKRWFLALQDFIYYVLYFIYYMEHMPGIPQGDAHGIHSLYAGKLCSIPQF